MSMRYAETCGVFDIRFCWYDMHANVLNRLGSEVENFEIPLQIAWTCSLLVSSPFMEQEDARTEHLCYDFGVSNYQKHGWW